MISFPEEEEGKKSCIFLSGKFSNSGILVVHFYSSYLNSLFFFRCENYAITLLEQCENLEEVETFLQTKTHDGREHKDANYIMAILVRYY